MDFRSIDEIVSHFDLVEKESDEVKRELKNLIKQVHPDINEGNFRNDKDKELFFEIQSALEFLDEKVTNTSLATKNDITALTTVLKELASSRKGEVNAEIISKKSSDLTSKLQQSIDTFYRRHSTPKITGLIATAIITALWAFPNIAKEHPLLSVLYRFNKEFTIFWLLSLFLSGILWLRIKNVERRDEEIKQNYKLESAQNYIFSLFIKWMQANHKNYEIREQKRIVKFCKDDLISFLLTRFEILQRHLRGSENLSDYEITKRISEFEEQNIYALERRGRKVVTPFNILGVFFPIPGEITTEIAQLICDLIIERLNSKEVIIKLSEKKLSDYFEYVDEI
jgi:hypothetical protein